MEALQKELGDLRLNIDNSEDKAKRLRQEIKKLGEMKSKAIETLTTLLVEYRDKIWLRAKVEEDITSLLKKHAIFQDEYDKLVAAEGEAEDQTPDPQ